MKIIKNDKGFIVSVTAIIVAVILGIMVLYFSNSIAPNVTSSANNYSSSQARWAAISGMEHAFHQLFFGLDDIAGVYPFYNGNIFVDTMTVNPVSGELQITSKGMHSSSTRIFSLAALPLPGDSTIIVGFQDGDGFMWDPYGEGPGPRYWGLSCEGYLPNDSLFYPQYVLNGADSCFFFGTKVQNNSNLVFNPIATNEGGYELVLSIAAGVDKSNPDLQSGFQTGDFFEVMVNGVVIQRWEGLSPHGGNPMYPTIDNATDSLGNLGSVLTPDFQDFFLNITDILGPLDTLQIDIEAKTNRSTNILALKELA